MTIDDATPSSTPEFTDRVRNLIAKSLPDTVDPRRRELLPKILCDWSSNDLREHLHRRRITPERRKRMERVGKYAHKLLQVLCATDMYDRTAIALKMRSDDGWTELDGLIKRIEEEISFLTKLEKAAPRTWKRGRGQPRNITAYLVMQDAAAIFQWLTNMEPTREVDRDSHSGTNAFWELVAAIWPVVFHSGDDGLPAAMKNWASLKSANREKSALIANIAMRHPTWGIFER